MFPASVLSIQIILIVEVFPAPLGPMKTKYLAFGDIETHLFQIESGIFFAESVNCKIYHGITNPLFKS
jgi:hypothetical protein